MPITRNSSPEDNGKAAKLKSAHDRPKSQYNPRGKVYTPFHHNKNNTRDRTLLFTIGGKGDDIVDLHPTHARPMTSHNYASSHNKQVSQGELIRPRNQSTANKKLRMQVTQLEASNARPKSATKRTSIVVKHMLDGPITNIQTRPDSVFFPMRQLNRAQQTEETLSRYTSDANKMNLFQLEMAYRREVIKIDKNKDDTNDREDVANQLKKFNNDLKIMRHKLRCIGGTDESHIIVSNKGKAEVDVIPNTIVYIRVPVHDKLVYKARLVFEPEPGHFIGKTKMTRKDEVIEARKRNLTKIDLIVFYS